MNTRGNLPAPILCKTSPSSKSSRSLRAENLLRARLRDAVGKREGELLGNKLLDVRPLDVLTLLELDNAQDLKRC